MKVYPNSLTEFINVEIYEIWEGTSANLIISDETGKKVYEKNQYAILEQIDIDNLKSGIYYLNVYLGERKVLYKIVKSEWNFHLLSLAVV